MVRRLSAAHEIAGLLKQANSQNITFTKLLLIFNNLVSYKLDHPLLLKFKEEIDNLENKLTSELLFRLNFLVSLRREVQTDTALSQATTYLAFNLPSSFSALEQAFEEQRVPNPNIESLH